MKKKVVIETKYGASTIEDVNWVTFDKKFVIVKSDGITSYFAYKDIINLVEYSYE